MAKPVVNLLNNVINKGARLTDALNYVLRGAKDGGEDL